MDNLSNKNHVMKCKHCNSTWNTSVQVAICPFCNKSLIDEDKYTTKTAIKKVVAANGIGILKNHKRLMSYIVDYVQGEDKEKKLLKIACNTGILEIAYEIKSISDNDQKLILVRKAKQLLENEAFLSEDNAKFILDIIMTALDISCGDMLKVAGKVENDSAIIPIDIESQKDLESSDTSCTITDEELIKNVSMNSQDDELSNRMSEKSRDIFARTAKEQQEFYHAAYIKSLVMNNAKTTEKDNNEIFAYGKEMIKKGDYENGIKYIRFASLHGHKDSTILLYRRSNGLCQYCGGNFTKKLFKGLMCQKCGRSKDY